MKQDRKSCAVLITGCSSGIGQAIARRLASDWTVYATARKPETLNELAAAGCRTLALDVTDESSMQQAVGRIEAESGAVSVLINNAGYSQAGAIETLRLDLIRKQFETNVFGALRLAQLVLPGMRRQGWGKIVNITSIGGKLVFPGAGAYHGSKFALEAFSDALRFETRKFGIDVIIIEPGLIITNFADAMIAAMEPGEGPYADFNLELIQATRDFYGKGLPARLGGGPDAVAKVVAKAISAKRPRPRYTVTPSAKILLGARSILSDRTWDFVVRTQFRGGKPRL